MRYIARPYLIIFILFFCKNGWSQQNSNTEIFFSSIKDLREMARVRLAARPDSADIYAIFTDSFAPKVMRYLRYWYSYRANIRGEFPDTLSPNFNNIVFNGIRTDLKMPAEYAPSEPRRYTVDSAFRNRLQHIWDIDISSGNQWSYFARAWVYINNRWIVLENLREMLYIILNDELLAYPGY